MTETDGPLAGIMTTPNGGKVHLAAGLDYSDRTTLELMRWAVERAAEDPTAYVFVGHCTQVERPVRWWRRLAERLMSG